MKKILLVLVGGTICTLADRGVRKIETEKARAILVEHFRRSDSPFADESALRIDVGARFDTLSENMSFPLWNNLKEYFEGRPYDGYDGVIVAHGTDTLAYTAAMFSFLLSGTEVPVFFVAANAPLDRAESNGGENFRAAAECICSGIAPNIYAAYRNPKDGKTYLHLASRLVQSADFEGNFFSRGMQDISTFAQRRAVRFGGVRMRADFGGALRGRKLENCVLKLDPYVGMDYGAYRLEQFRAVLHGTYHSGTVCAGSPEQNGNILRLAQDCEQRGIGLYVVPVNGMREGGEIYESMTPVLRRARFLFGLTEEAAYAKLSIAYSCLTGEEFWDFLGENINGEYADDNGQG